MDAKIENSDIAVDSIGNYVMIDGFEELAQQALIGITVPKGAFIYDRTLGSDCYSYDYLSDSKKVQVFEMLMNEALALMGDVYVKVKSVVRKNNKAEITFSLLSGEFSTDKKVVI